VGVIFGLKSSAGKLRILLSKVFSGSLVNDLRSDLTCRFALELCFNKATAVPFFSKEVSSQLMLTGYEVIA
jgi:hypothetical protein